MDIGIFNDTPTFDVGVNTCSRFKVVFKFSNNFSLDVLEALDRSFDKAFAATSLFYFKRSVFFVLRKVIGIIS
ncbi:hypothetical protein ABI36_0218190 [Pseudomonas aeruginosa]|uniref:Uncharacterized protein n=1 Tax=Pseudomonas putida TaxID=303 RepID=A0A177SNE3_PSEPU|nr:hypothetical protein AN450_00465 [Pseudomonas aeruginosa]OAI92576.1 hypothetical protein AYO28_18375 [Pseudomonas putida]OHW57748.1 hypothetical protein ABI36_0218190 [Pseudomonas aeruginosa]